MIGCESELLSLKSEYALICNIIALNYLILYVLRLTDECIRLAVVKLNASRKSKRELILKREQEIAVKDLLLGKNFLAVLPTGYGKSLIFTLFLLARENITRINTDGRIVFIATPTGLTGLLRLDLLAASLSELFKAFFTTGIRSGDETVIGN